MRLKNKQSGFTIIELMIATTVFSVVLLLCTYGLIEIGRNYYKGAAVARTQNATRAAMDDISQAIQYGASAPVFVGTASVPPDGPTPICIGGKKYIVGRNHGFTVERSGNVCVLNTVPTANPRQQLLGTNMRLNQFSIVESDSEYTVIMQVVYGDTDTYNVATGQCNGGRSSQFCASSRLESTVRRRVN